MGAARLSLVEEAAGHDDQDVQERCAALTKGHKPFSDMHELVCSVKTKEVQAAFQKVREHVYLPAMPSNGGPLLFWTDNHRDVPAPSVCSVNGEIFRLPPVGVDLLNT